MKSLIKSSIIYILFYLLLLFQKEQIGFENTVLAGITLCIVLILENNIEKKEK